MENNVEISNIEINDDIEIKENFHYVGVVFENKSNYGKQYQSKVYEYKTIKPLKEGQVIKVQTMYGESNVVVVKENIPEDELQFQDKEAIKEI